MMRSVVHIVFFLSFLIVKGQESQDSVVFATPLEREVLSARDSISDPLLFLMVYDPNLDSTGYLIVRDELNAFTDRLNRKRSQFKSDVNFIRYVFRKVHKKYLHQYIRYGSFNELFYSGNYNCLSGTALYAYILNDLGFEIRIFETKYHSFLTVNAQGKPELLIEATDLWNGLVEGNNQVLSRIAEYQRREGDVKFGADTLLLIQHPLLTHIQLKELAALHYFNLAVVAFNNALYSNSLCYLKKAETLYPDSQRIKDLIIYAKDYAQFSMTESLSPKNSNAINNTYNQKRK